MLEVSIQTIPHEAQRYDTCGDWQGVEGLKLKIRVSDLQNSDYEFLVAVHELIEAYLCVKRGISETEVDAFDMAFEKARTEGSTDEPGDDPAAPYHREHVFAASIERQLAAELGINWIEYEAAINNL